MAFKLFCCEFGNVVNRAFLVLIFWIKKLVGANFTRFCNYEYYYNIIGLQYRMHTIPVTFWKKIIMYIIT